MGQLTAYLATTPNLFVQIAKIAYETVAIQRKFGARMLRTVVKKYIWNRCLIRS